MKSVKNSCGVLDFLAMASEVQSFPVGGGRKGRARLRGDPQQAVSSGERALEAMQRVVCISGSRTVLLTWWVDLERVLENKSRARRRHAPNSKIAPARSLLSARALALRPVPTKPDIHSTVITVKLNL